MPGNPNTPLSSRSKRSLRRISGLAVVLIVLSWVAYEECSPRVAPPLTLTVYAASTMEEVLLDAVLPAFRRDWEARTGQRIDFVTAFGGSGEITDRILTRVPVDVALLSSELDALRLAEHGLVVGPSWRKLPNRGVFCKSPMVIVVRPDNPKRIRDFADLARNDVELVCPDPRLSAAGEWGLLAAFIAARSRLEEDQAAWAEIERLLARVTLVEHSARAARLAFDGGAGDALVTYERETIDTESTRPGERIYPTRTLMSEHVVCRIDRHVSPDESEVVDALITFLWSDLAQDRFVRHGFRGIDPVRTRRDRRFEEPREAVTLEDLGGAGHVRSEWVEPLLQRFARSGARPTT